MQVWLQFDSSSDLCRKFEGNNFCGIYVSGDLQIASQHRHADISTDELIVTKKEHTFNLLTCRFQRQSALKFTSEKQM